MKIAIIGAGLSGLTLAHKLKGSANLSLFEKSRGFGGRMATRRCEGFHFDHGAQFFRAKTSSFQSFLKPMIDKKIIQVWKGVFMEFERDKISCQKNWGENPPHYVGVPGMNAIGKHLAKTLNNTSEKSLQKDIIIHTNTKVTKILPAYNTKSKSGKKLSSGMKWELKEEQGQAIGVFDWVITTVPPEQAVFIMPQSFKHYSQLSQIKMKACFSLMLGFKEALPLKFHSALVRGCDISWISVNSSKPERGEPFCLLVNSTNDWADCHIDIDKEEVIKHLCQETSFVLGHHVLKADHKSLHRWRYANIKKQARQNWIDEKNQLAVCGDWTNQGRVESAFLSAKKTALTLKKTIASKYV